MEIMECRQDCYWYEEVPDMGARIPFCKLKKGITPIGHEDCEKCENYHSKYKPSRADCIRAMTDEELAKFLKEQTCLAHNYGYECADGEPDFLDGIPTDYDYLTWLRQEA